MIDIFSHTNKSQTNEHALVQVGALAFPISHQLKNVMELVQPGMNRHVMWATDGNWSMIDMLVALMAKMFPCDVTISSYAFSEKPARIIADMKESGHIRRLDCIIDSRVDVRAASALNLVQSAADRCVLCDTHAKVTLLANDEHCLTVVGSANYTANKRYEAGMITDSQDIYNFYYGWIQLAMDRRDAE
jgi:hypothetical protein